MFAYVGTRTTRERNARGEGISVFRYQPNSGTLELVQVVSDLVNPSYLLMNAAKNVLYTVHGDQDLVSSFKVDASSGKIERISQQCTGGKNPVHLALDKDEKHLVVSNHISSSIAVLPVSPSGEIQELLQLVKLDGEPGPHRKEQPFAKPHFNAFDHYGKWVLVPDKGVDRVFIFRFLNGKLIPAERPFLQCREGSGPRHLDFHPFKSWVYVINELDSTVTACLFDVDTGVLQPFQIVSTLSDRFTGNSRAAAIRVSADGSRVYASNRGEDSVAVFEVDGSTGALSLIQTKKVEGKTPRFFTVDPSGKVVLVLNEDSDAICGFDVDPVLGTLTTRVLKSFCGSPVSLVFGS